MAESDLTDPLPGKILKAIQTNSGLMEISIAECIEEMGRIRYRGKLYVPAIDTLHLWMIQNHYHTVLAGHMGRVNTFNLFELLYYCNEMLRHVDQLL
jgi:hypothetical protein